uniref:diacylglycerol O-acyltransferase n=1 Tax=Plectus sambesii TaxID=2011161 RepID=A0A914UIK1_9BILA
MVESPTKVGRVHFAPLNVPLQRRLQTFAAFYYSFMTFFFPLLNIFLPFYIVFYTSYWWVLAIYAIFYIYDYQTPKRGGRPNRFLQEMTLHKWFAEYFPIQLVKTAEVKPNHNYLFGYHPHGVISIGALTSFGTAAAGVSEKFPKLKFRLATLGGNFFLPVRREYLIAFGLIDCGRESLEHVLSNEEKGQAVVLVI